MYRGFRPFAAWLLTAALGTPGALLAQPKCVNLSQEQEEHHDRDDRDRNDRDRNNQRYYDREHRDYHNWDDREDQSYRRWLDERHESYREFNRLKRRDQNAYWNWRHNHEEHEEHEHQ
jgi:hypothetical protein